MATVAAMGLSFHVEPPLIDFDMDEDSEVTIQKPDLVDRLTETGTSIQSPSCHEDLGLEPIREKLENVSLLAGAPRAPRHCATVPGGTVPPSPALLLNAANANTERISIGGRYRVIKKLRNRPSRSANHIPLGEHLFVRGYCGCFCNAACCIVATACSFKAPCSSGHHYQH